MDGEIKLCMWFWRYIKVFSKSTWKNWRKCYNIRVFLDSSAVEHSAVNRRVVGSNPTRGARQAHSRKSTRLAFLLKEFGSVVKRLRHRPFTAVTRVQFPSESFVPMWLNWQSSWFVISRLSVRVRSSAFIQFHIVYMGRFPSGQRGQTVNLLQIASVVRIHLCPFKLILL